jgi:precorrin-6Y C5,15-methyltransferase (decarboxylating)
VTINAGDPSLPHPRVTVVGIGADGWDGLGEPARRLIEQAPLIIAGHRQQTLLPDIPGQDRRRWPTPMLPSLSALLEEYRDRAIVVVASGDPLVSGVGSTLIDRLGSDNVRIIPAVSSVAMARARMGWSAESVDVVTVVGRDPHAVLAAVTPQRRLIVLSSDQHTPALLAELLRQAGHGPTRMTVWGSLGSADETRIDGTAGDWVETDTPRLNLICLEVSADPTTMLLPGVPGLPDDAYEHDGQLTKRDLRASALARLAPVPGQLLWDVGAGAGSVAIEWMRSDPRCRAVAVDQDPNRAERLSRNASRLGVPSLRVVTGKAPDALAGLPRPDAIFIGGGASIPGVIDTCWAALSVGGRLVIHAVTLETEALMINRYASFGGELVRLSVEHAAPIGSFTGWTPARAVTQWAVRKESGSR